MSVLITGQTLVVRMDRLDALYPGGFKQFRANARNATVHADRFLCAQSFMTPVDIQHALDELEALGLAGKEGHAWVDVALVWQDLGVLGECDWLEFSRLPDGESIAWLKGTDPGGIVRPDGWSNESSRAVRYYSPEDQAKYLRYLGSEDGLDVSIDTRTGTRLYLGQIEGERAGGLLPLRTQWLEQRARELGEPACEVPDDLAVKELGEIAEEAGFYSTLEGRHQAYAAFVQGLALRIGGNWAEAERAYLRRVAMGNAEPGIWLEITWVLAEQGKYGEALESAHRALAGMPESPAAWGNLASTLMNMGCIAEAKEAIARALALDPEDAVNLQIEALLDVDAAAPPAGG